MKATRNILSLFIFRFGEILIALIPNPESWISNFWILISKSVRRFFRTLKGRVPNLVVRRSPLHSLPTFLFFFTFGEKFTLHFLALSVSLWLSVRLSLSISLSVLLAVVQAPSLLINISVCPFSPSVCFVVTSYLFLSISVCLSLLVCVSLWVCSVASCLSACLSVHLSVPLSIFLISRYSKRIELSEVLLA